MYILFCSIDFTYHFFLGLILYIFISDLADGWLARKFKSTTKAGAIFDYVVDRFNSYLIVGLLINKGVHVIVFIPFFLRDMIYIFVQTYLSIPRISGSKFVSFISTSSLYIFVIYSKVFGVSISFKQSVTLLILLCFSLINLLIRVYKRRKLLIEELRKDFLLFYS